MSSTLCAQRSLRKDDGFVLYMFKEDLEMIEKWAAEPSYKKPKGGFLFGLWTNTLNPVVHNVSKDHTAAAVNAEDYLFIKSPQFQNVNAFGMFSLIGSWSFENSIEKSFQDRRFVFLGVEKKGYLDSISFHPALSFKGQNTSGKIDILQGKNPFKLPEDPSTLTTKGENLKEENNKSLVASIKDKFESGVTKVTSNIPNWLETLGIGQESTIQASTVEQNFQDNQSTMPPLARSGPRLPSQTTPSFPSQYETKDISTCTKKNQWYLSESSQKDLQEISKKLEELINNKPKISRDNDTHNIMILFSFENKSYVITFPPSFPELNAELYRRLQSRNNRPYASSFKLQSKEPTSLVQEIFDKLLIPETSI